MQRKPGVAPAVMIISGIPSTARVLLAAAMVKSPLTLSLSPRGESTLEFRSPIGEGAAASSLSPRGEGWGEGVFCFQWERL